MKECMKLQSKSRTGITIRDDKNECDQIKLAIKIADLIRLKSKVKNRCASNREIIGMEESPL